MTTASTPPPDARFQVDDEEPIPLERLLRANPELTEDDVDIICAMALGTVHCFGHSRLRRTR